MLTVREAMQRLGQYNIKLSRYGSLQWRLSYREDPTLEHSRLVDSLEDAVMVASDMRALRSEETTSNYRYAVPKASPSRCANRRQQRSIFVYQQLARLEMLRAI